MSLVTKITHAVTGCCCDDCFSSYPSTFGQGTYLHICLPCHGRPSQSIGGMCACQYGLLFYYIMHSPPFVVLLFHWPSLSKSLSIIWFLNDCQLRLETPTDQRIGYGCLSLKWESNGYEFANTHIFSDAFCLFNFCVALSWQN